MKQPPCPNSDSGAYARQEGRRVVAQLPLWRFATLVIGALLLVASPGEAQPDPKITVGFGTARPGRTATIPVSLEGGSGRDVSRIVLQVRFPANDVEFVRLERAALGAEAGLETKSTVREVEPGRVETTGDKRPRAERILEIEAWSSGSGGPIPDGIITYLVFRVAERKDGGAADAKLTVTGELLKVVDGTPAPVASVAAEGEILTESDAPIIACFFYMH